MADNADPRFEDVNALIGTQPFRRPLEQHAMAAFPNEACALIVAGPGGYRLILADNVADHWHAIDPAGFPRTAAEAYILDPMLIVDAERRGETLIAIVHSHCRVGAYFSAEDVRLALTDDGSRPLFPGVQYIVLDVQDGGLRGWKTFVWSPIERAFKALQPPSTAPRECGVAPHVADAVEGRLTEAYVASP